MAKKIKKRTKPDRTGKPTVSLSQIFGEIAVPLLPQLGRDPVPATMNWAMTVVATAWNASRNADESDGLRELDEATPRLVTPAFPDQAVLGAILEEVFHLSRVRHPRDPRRAIKVFVERRGVGDYHVEVVAGVPKRT